MVELGDLDIENKLIKYEEINSDNLDKNSYINLDERDLNNNNFNKNKKLLDNNNL